MSMSAARSRDRIGSSRRARRRRATTPAAYYLIGTADSKRDRFLSTSPASMLQGDNRYYRWEKFRRYVGLFPEWHNRAVFAEVLGAGHSSAPMFDSRAARKAVFE